MNELAFAYIAGFAVWCTITVGRQLVLGRSVGEQSYSRMLFDAVIALMVFLSLAFTLDHTRYVYAGLGLILADVITLYPRHKARH